MVCRFLSNRLIQEELSVIFISNRFIEEEVSVVSLSNRFKQEELFVVYILFIENPAHRESLVGLYLWPFR